MMNKQQTQQRIDAIKAELEQLKQSLLAPEPIRYKPEEGEEYWYVGWNGCIYAVYWTGDEYDHYRHAIGNCFKTKEEAEHHLAKQLAQQKIFDYIAKGNRDKKPLDWSDFGQWKCRVSYDHEKKKLITGSSSYLQHTDHRFYGHEDVIKQAAVDLKTEYKLIFNVEGE